MVGRYLIAYAMVGVALTGPAAAAELAPGSGHSIRLAAFDGVVYYTVEQDGYRVVATLASNVDALPIRITSTLLPGQRAVVSVPQADGQPSLDFELLRDGDALVVIDAVAPALNVEPPTVATSAN
jgi:hypothetical protein